MSAEQQPKPLTLTETLRAMAEGKTLEHDTASGKREQIRMVGEAPYHRTANREGGWGKWDPISCMTMYAEAKYPWHIVENPEPQWREVPWHEAVDDYFVGATVCCDDYVLAPNQLSVNITKTRMKRSWKIKESD